MNTIPGTDNGFPTAGAPEQYLLDNACDEMFEHDGATRPHYRALKARLDDFGPDEMFRRQQVVDRAFLHQGITFTVYSEDSTTERIFPTDCLPRILTASEWQHIEAGLAQRIEALNLFLKDIYGEAKILADGIVPRDLNYSCPQYRREMCGVQVSRDVHVSICGSDLVRIEDGRFAVLEDNLRVPSGVSYMLVNRDVIRRAFPALYRGYNVQRIESYCESLLGTLRSLAPGYKSNPRIVLLTPGVFNSAYFEHAYLARRMGIELVEGRDLTVHDNIVYMRTTSGLRRVDVIYRRIDDDFIDPIVFRQDSTLGIPGLFNAFRAGNVAIANAPGTGVADDKAVYAYVPRIIRYYLDAEPILPNIETWLCREPDSLKYVLAHLDEMVVKAVGESGGYGMLVGPHASAEQVAQFRRQLIDNPNNYVAQRTLALSRAPCFVNGQLEGRHVDLRPFILQGERTTIVPGGLTRVALKRGSLVVNSSQGGGSKDTWVLGQ
jgi:uncharacterized circularly permuted ATP-grasp superfamily protein